MDALDSCNLHPQPCRVVVALPPRHLREAGVNVVMLVLLPVGGVGEIFRRGSQLEGIARAQIHVFGAAAQAFQHFQKLLRVDGFVRRRFFKNSRNPLEVFLPRHPGVDGVAGSRLRFPGEGTNQIFPGFRIQKVHNLWLLSLERIPVFWNNMQRNVPERQAVPGQSISCITADPSPETEPPHLPPG